MEEELDNDEDSAIPQKSEDSESGDLESDEEE